MDSIRDYLRDDSKANLYNKFRPILTNPFTGIQVGSVDCIVCDACLGCVLNAIPTNLIMTKKGGIT